MKKSIKTILGTSVLSLSLLVGAIPSFASATSEHASGGWSESGGYYVNSQSEDGISTLASSTPDSHVGKRLKDNTNSGGDPTWRYAAKGDTVWVGVYHYTTAQMETPNGTVKTTSGRQWGENGTTATSPWYTPFGENPEARTYWGH
ncbi:hypothetical protein [Paenibacillus gallinarum]|uniref:Bacteriocin n=1 Tax=Paenibacillus gallinarum TaxID=2762232 RepID=A0ABR8T6X5_9BACL|nr:hypothetical protein [Paenibacillus gallinarum]MBD7971359.1 hypothetical protein [Paenibacillus gallinarum]